MSDPAAPVQTDPPAPAPPLPAALPPAPVQPAAPPAPAAPLPPPPPAGQSKEALEAEVARLRADTEAARRLNTELSQAATQAKAELHRTLVTAELTALATKTVAPAHVVALVREAFEVDAHGKVTVRGRSDVTPAQYMEAWLAGEGKHFLPPSVPAGAGSSAFPGSAPQAQPMDLRTASGATSFVHSLLAPTPAPPAAPAQPARSGSTN